jgi:hypothetical protein
MSARADPRVSGGGLFAVASDCDFSHCLVVDDTHAVASGTSMAAPLVSGAIALLFERQPELTARQVRAYLQAGARQVRGTVVQSTGAGALDLPASFAALEGGTAVAGLPSAATSFLALADNVARPDPDWPLRGLLQLRDSRGRPADGLSAQDLSITALPGDVSRQLHREAPGLWSFEVTAPSGTGGQDLEIAARFRGAVLAEQRVPIAVDRSVAGGEAYARGGNCSAVGPRPGWAGKGWWLALAVVPWAWRRLAGGRSPRETRMARNRDREAA